MGFFDRKAEDLAVKLIARFTGQLVDPIACVPCEATITPDWKGYCVLTEDSLFLVNKYGARGVNYQNLSGTNSWGQYPKGTKGYPNYRFGFQFMNNPQGFTVFSKTSNGGEILELHLNKLFQINN
jgi:hypothetical protein